MGKLQYHFIFSSYLNISREATKMTANKQCESFYFTLLKEINELVKKQTQSKFSRAIGSELLFDP